MLNIIRDIINSGDGDMEKIFNKYENIFTIALIVIYVVVNSYFVQNFVIQVFNRFS